MENSRILHLTLKKKWFDMIASGEKKEEYREFKPYWTNRLININYPIENKRERKVIPWDIEYDIKENGYPVDVVLKTYFCEVKNFDTVLFRNGYSKNAPAIMLECKGIIIDKGNPDWGAPLDKKVFIIKLGKILTTPQGSKQK